jgi:uncharacterized membrane protein
MPDDPNQRHWPIAGMLRHAALAGGFFFVLQHLVLRETLSTSLLWAAFFAAAAAGLAWHQARRR